jgi:hypothetical protein
MYYQLPNGKVIYLTIEQYLDLTDEDVQYLMAHDAGEHINNAFSDSAVIQNEKEKYYDFDYLPDDENDPVNGQDIMSDDQPFDDIIDITGPLDI